jgi:nicotinamidase-related amidase
MANENPLLKLLKPLPEVRARKDNTALLTVDVQYLTSHYDFGIFAAAKEKGAEEALSYYRKHVETMIQNIVRLQKLFRQNKMEVIHTKIESLTLDGRERSKAHKDKEIFAPKGSKEGQILEEIKPLENEIVLPKTTSSVFNGTALDQILRNLGIGNLVVTGVVTNNCVENAVRDASDKGYAVILVEDGCAAVTEEIHNASIRAMRDHFAKVKSCAEVIELVNKMT